MPPKYSFQEQHCNKQISNAKQMPVMEGAIKEFPKRNALSQACKWQVKKLPEIFSANKLRHIVSHMRYEQNID